MTRALTRRDFLKGGLAATAAGAYALSPWRTLERALAGPSGPART